MSDLLLYAAGWLTVTMALRLGETDVLPRVRVEPERLGSLIRPVWHRGAVAWTGSGISTDRRTKHGIATDRTSIIGTAIGIYGFTAIVNAWRTREVDISTWLRSW